MTETVFTFLLTALLFAATRENLLDRPESSSGSFASSAPPTAARTNLHFRLSRQVAIGTLFGLCALCRPTIWPVGLLAGVCWALCAIRRRGDGFAFRNAPWLAVLSAVVVVSPWLVRNFIVFHKPIVTTTHGGYTLLLGNNSVYYRQEVDQPFGTVWEDAPSGHTQQDWLREIRQRMRDELGDDASEPARDRWMYHEAFKTIKEEPGTFLRACLLRFVKFWNVVPLGKARDAIPTPIVWGIAVFYTLEICGFLFGVTRVPRRRWIDWMPLFVSIVGFSLVHLVFWTNARMRAPVLPAISLFCALAAKSLLDASQGGQPGRYSKAPARPKS
jgi:hypothetical protein